MSYNGWTNYETWVLKSWMDNTRVTEYYEDASKHMSLYDVMESIQDYYTNENYPECLNVASAYSDILKHGLGNVNWIEIAESICQT